MVLLKISFVFICIFKIIASQQINLPPSIKLCQRASPNLANCVKNSIEHILPFLKSGQLGNGFTIDTLEPFAVDDVFVEIGKGFYVNMKNMRSYNVLDFKVEKLRINLNSMEIEILALNPYIETKCDYKLKMQFGVVNINGEGKCKNFQENTRTHIKAKFVLYTDRNGVEYAKFVSAETKFKVEKHKFSMDNLFKDKGLNDLSNELINQNSHLFFDEIQFYIAKSFSKTFVRVANQIVQKIPYNVLFS